MKLPFFKSLFTNESKLLKLPDSILIKRIKAIADTNSILLFSNVTIYHHTQQHVVPLLLLDETRGLYIFEKKEWTYDELKNSTIEQSKNQETSKNTLSFQNIQSLINQKLNELTHKDGVPIYNYLLMENLNASQYEHLNDSFKKLLPRDKIVFSDSSTEEITNKLQKINISSTPLANSNHILGNLLVQYSILDKDLKPCLASKEQMLFLDSDLQGTETIQAIEKSGKSSVILLKAIIQKINYPEKSIIIIKPSLLAADILRKRLLEIVEHAIIEVNFSSIEIITPIELVERHRQALKMKPLTQRLHIENTLMGKKYHHADSIFCDDADMLSPSFIEYLVHIQKDKNLLLVNSFIRDTQFNFTESFLDTPSCITFHQANQHAKALQLMLFLSETEDNIMVLAQKKSRKKLIDDMKAFIEKEPNLLDSTKNLMSQKLDMLILTGYDDVNELEIQNLILLDVCLVEKNKIEYALKRAQKSIHIVYEENCTITAQLKEEYANC